MARTVKLGKVKGKDYVLTENDKMNIAQKVVPDATSEAISLIEGYNGYEGYNDILGLQVDYENKKFTRLAGAAGKEAGDDFDGFPMYGGMKRCNVKTDGTIVAYYGESGYADDNTATQTMVEMPKFYYKVVPLKLEKIEDSPGYHIRKANYYITDKQYPGFKLHPAFINEQGNEIDKFYFSAYEGYLTESGNYYNDAIHMETTTKTVDPKIHTISSRANRKPISGQNFKLYRSSEEQCISKLGSGWHLETMKAHSAIQFLMMIEYGKLNMQPTSSTDKTAFAYGVCYTTAPYETVNRCATTGATASLGNKSGIATSTSFSYYDVETKITKTETKTDWQSLSCSYRGIENPYGNLFRHLQGINIYGNGSMKGGEAYICDDFNFQDQKTTENYKPVGFYLADTNNFTSAFGYGDPNYDWLFLTSENKGTSALPVGDRVYGTVITNNRAISGYSGSWLTGTGAGIFLNKNDMTITQTSYNTGGSRMIFVP